MPEEEWKKGKESGVLGKTFEFTEKIDEGSFGEIYEARDIDTNTRVAVKLEKTESKC